MIKDKQYIKLKKIGKYISKFSSVTFFKGILFSHFYKIYKYTFFFMKNDKKKEENILY